LPEEPDLRYHPLTFVAFLLAVFILILPVQADMVFVSLRSGRLAEAIATIVVTIGVVAAPLLFAQRSTKRHPEKWKPRFMTTLTWTIIAFNVALNVFILLSFKKG